MTLELTKRHRESLEALRDECSYEDARPGGYQNAFVSPGRFPGGAKTISELLAWGHIVEGTIEWNGTKGYRITSTGEAA